MSLGILSELGHFLYKQKYNSYLPSYHSMLLIKLYLY